MNKFNVLSVAVLAAFISWFVTNNVYQRQAYRHVLKDYHHQMTFGPMSLCEPDSKFTSAVSEIRSKQKQLLKEAGTELNRIFPDYRHIDNNSLMPFWHYEKGPLETRCLDLLKRGLAVRE